MGRSVISLRGFARVSLQTGGMVDEAPWKAELLCDVGGESLDTEGFRRVMTGVEEIHAEFFGQSVGVMGAFAAKERIAPEFRCLRDL